MEENLGAKPAQAVVDTGFTNRDNIVACAAQKVDLVGSLARPEERSEAAMKAQGIDPAFAPHRFCILEAGHQLQCPAGGTLPYVRQSQKRGDVYQQYQARGEDCLGCRYQPQCCPKGAERGGPYPSGWRNRPMWRPFARRWSCQRAEPSTGGAGRWPSVRQSGATLEKAT